MHNRSKNHCSPKYDVLLGQRQSPFPRYSHGCCTHYRGNTPSTLNPLPRYYREFQSHSRGNTANIATVSLLNEYQHCYQYHYHCFWFLLNHPIMPGTGIRGPTMASLPRGNQELVVTDKVGRPPGELGVSKSMECDIFSSVL